MLRITADANVIISALNFSGNPRAVLNLAAEGKVHLSISEDILGEVARVLRRPKFGWPEDRIDKALVQLSHFTEHVTPTQRIEVVRDDPDDDRILDCALAGGSDYLVTGDKHLLNIGQYQGVKIVTPAQFIDLLAQQGRVR